MLQKPAWHYIERMHVDDVGISGGQSGRHPNQAGMTQHLLCASGPTLLYISRLPLIVTDRCLKACPCHHVVKSTLPLTAFLVAFSTVQTVMPGV